MVQLENASQAGLTADNILEDDHPERLCSGGVSAGRKDA